MNSFGSLVSALAAGLLFGMGLIVSGMINPAKIQNFLDIAGTWDPSLAFVMGGAIAVAMPAFYLLQKKTAPVFAKAFQWPTTTSLDKRLITGAAIFGIGWGISGFCPGPAITAVPIAFIGGETVTSIAWFVPAMLLGLFAAKMYK